MFVSATAQMAEFYEKPDINRTTEKQLSRFIETKING